MKNITNRQINSAKKEIQRLKLLKKKFRNEPEAQEDINILIEKHTKFVSRGQEILQDRKIRPLC